MHKCESIWTRDPEAVRLIDAQELKYRLKLNGIEDSRVLQTIEYCPTRWEEEDGAYIPCEHHALLCRSCKYAGGLGCERPGGKTEHDWNFKSFEERVYMEERLKQIKNDTKTTDE